MLGAVPFLDAYIACVPATLELWLSRGWMIATAFFLFHFIPFNIVVTDFYKEIKGCVRSSPMIFVITNVFFHLFTAADIPISLVSP